MGQLRVHPTRRNLVGFLTAVATAAALLVATASPATAHCPAGEGHSGGVHRRIDRVLDQAEHTRKTRGGTAIYEKQGGLRQANRDFDYIRGSRPFQRHNKDPRTRWVTYPDGTKVGVYPESKAGPPTMHIIRARRPETKVRYP